LPEKLEIYEDGDWIQMEYKEDFTSTYKEAEILGGDEVPLAFTPSKYYQNVRPGHYRYTHQVGVEKVEVEFDITEGKSVQEEGNQVIFGEEPSVIVLEAPVTSLALGDNLVINTIIAGKGSWDFTDISELPGKLEKCEDEAWTPMEYNDENIDWADIDNMIIGSCFRREIVDLDKYYLNVGFGHYRYTYEIGGYEYVFEFDIIEPTITVEVVNSPVALGDDLRIVLSSSGIAEDDNVSGGGYLDHKLEIYEDGEWKEMTRLEGTCVDRPLNFKNSSEEFKLCLSEKAWTAWVVYEDLRAGHYRYSHMINGEYYSDEFDIIEPTITVEVVNSLVALGDDLRIVLSSSGIAENDNVWTDGFLSSKLEIYEDGEWKEMTRLEGAAIEPFIYFKNYSYEFTLCLSSKEGCVWAVYEDLRAGHYRYSHMINREYYSDEFDIVEP